MPKRLAFIGDSLTEWFDWQRRFPEYEVQNLGVSGETVEELLDRRNFIRSRAGDPDVLFLMTGINNILQERYSITGPIREIVRNLTTWYKDATVVVQSLLPVELSWIGGESIRDVNRTLALIAGESGAAYLDLYSLFVDSAGNPKSGLLSEDGVHLSNRGYEVWSGAVEEFLAGKS